MHFSIKNLTYIINFNINLFNFDEFEQEEVIHPNSEIIDELKAIEIDEIVKNQKYPRPLFFKHFEKLPKEYIYINSKTILQEKLKNRKDV